jgi:hypothetical protein
MESSRFSDVGSCSRCRRYGQMGEVFSLWKYDIQFNILELGG